MKTYISLLLILNCCFASVQAFELIHSDYGQDFYFVFDGGSNDGITKGMNACVYDESDEELFCGKVSRVNETRAGVYAGPEQEAWLEKGFYVKVKELKDSPKNNRMSRVSQSLAEISSQNFVKRNSRWNSGYTLTPVMPFQFSHPTFDIDARIAGTGPIWTAGENTKQSLVGLNVSHRRQLTGPLDHEVAFLWRYLRPIETDSDYDPNSGQVYVVEKSSASDFSFEWNVLSSLYRGGVETYLVSGVGIESLSYSFNASVVDDEDGSQSASLAASKASLLGMFGKIGVAFEKPFGQIKDNASRGLMSLRISTLVPVYSKTTWKHGEHQLASDTTQKDDSPAELEETVKLKKNTFGMELGFTAGWSF